MSSLAAITSLYLFSRRMVLPRRAKIAIGFLAAMAYTQVEYQTQKWVYICVQYLWVLQHCVCVLFRLPLVSAPCYCTSPLRWQQLTSLAQWLFCLLPFGFWQSSAKCLNKSPFMDKSNPVQPPGETWKSQQCHKMKNLLQMCVCVCGGGVLWKKILHYMSFSTSKWRSGNQL